MQLSGKRHYFISHAPFMIMAYTKTQKFILYDQKFITDNTVLAAEPIEAFTWDIDINLQATLGRDAE